MDVLPRAFGCANRPYRPRLPSEHIKIEHENIIAQCFVCCFSVSMRRFKNHFVALIYHWYPPALGIRYPQHQRSQLNIDNKRSQKWIGEESWLLISWSQCDSTFLMRSCSRPSSQEEGSSPCLISYISQLYLFHDHFKIIHSLPG